MGSEFYISGYVLDHNTSTGLEGVTVRLFQNVMQDKNHYGTAISNVAGNFRLVVPTTLLQAGRLSIEFYSDGQRLHVDQGVEEWDPANPPLDHVFRLLPPQVPERPEDPQFGPVGPGQYYVQGLIKYTDGTPLPSSVTVRAYDRKLENTVFFTGNLGAQGDYHVEFPTQTAPKHIFVEVLDGSTVISASRILCDPFVSAQTARIDITITADPYRRFRQPVEYDRLAAALPNMPAGSDLMSMNRDDIILLGCDEKFPLDMIRAYVLSHQIDQVLSLDQKEALYGLMRQGLPTTPHVLAALPKSVLRNALERAAAADQISQSIVTNADVGILDDLRNSTVDFMRDLNSSDSIGNVLLKGSSRMQSAGDKLSGSELTRFAESWLDSVDKNETASQFWERVSASTLFNDDETQMAKRAVRYGNLMLNNTTLMQRFDLAYSGTTPSTAVPVSKTVELSVADWVALIDPAPQGSDVALPTGWTFEGDSVTAYAELLFQHAERAFASEKTVFALKQAETSDVEVFLTNNPEFHFLQTNVSTFLTAPSTNTTGLDVPSLQARLEKLQRLYRVTPIQDRYAAIAALESGGMTSAMSIARLGRKAFIDQFAPSLGADGNNRAGEIYQSAQKMVAMSTALVLQSHEGFTRSGFTGGPGYIDGDFDAIAINMNANHQNVFSERLCECDVCGSILSPAAYFVDLQQWMEYQDPNQNVVQLLHERRPDLGDLKLHCENALRVLPYIDLVNEQLEVAVIKEKALLDGQMSTASVPVETTWTEAQLLAQPEHPQPLAYDILKSAYWPHRLPFHAELESVRAYLDLFDIDHAAFVETLTLPGTAEDGRYSLFLGVNLAEEGLMTNASPTSSPSARELWGYPMMPSNVSHPVAISDSVSWTVALQYVPEFMKRAGLESYDTLLDVVHTRYLNRDGYFQIVVATDANGCDVREQYFNQAYTSGGTHTFPGSADFTRAHGFLRLMKRTGWSPLKLDKALHALSDGTGITRAVLQRVVAAYRLQRQLGVDLTPMLSWWSLMDTYSDRNSKDHPEPSLYHRVFFEMMQVYASGQLFALDASTTTPIELMSPSSEGLIDNYGADLIGAFNTTMEALSTAEKQVVDELSPSAVTRLERNLQHIWLLYRRVHLANTA
ncbi:MAG: Tc toxin subunit A, partial [Myxococcota bacterium]